MLKIEVNGVIVPVPPDVASDGSGLAVEQYLKSVTGLSQKEVDSRHALRVQSLNDAAAKTAHASEVERRNSADARVTVVAPVTIADTDETGG